MLDTSTCPSTAVISFNIPGPGPYTISLLSALPVITHAMLIDGWSQPGWAGQPLIELNGSQAGAAVDGLSINASKSSVRGLIINSFSGNGIAIIGEGTSIQGSYIGTDPTGLQSAANGLDGIRVTSPNNMIGGPSSTAGNLISGNRGRGIVLLGTGASGNRIQSNIIGRNAGSTRNLGNGQEGIVVAFGANANVIGGMFAGAGNTISGNGYAGVSILSWNTPTNGNALLGNAIYSNSQAVLQPDIDLNSDGMTGNNGAFDGYQANNGIDYPTITLANINSGILTVSGYVGSAPNQQAFADLRVEIFKSDTSSSGYGGGQVYLGFLTTDANGNFSGTITTALISAGDTITSTATDTNGNTSEFGPNSQLP